MWNNGMYIYSLQRWWSVVQLIKYNLPLEHIYCLSFFFAWNVRMIISKRICMYICMHSYALY